MNINVIAEIEVNEGRLGIIGTGIGTVVFMLTGLTLYGMEDWDRVAKTWIETRSVGMNKDTIIFERNLVGELRNPHKLLKSVRSKVLAVTNAAYSQFSQEMADLDDQIDRAWTYPY